MCTGTKCVEDAELVVKHAVDAIRKTGIDVKLESIKVRTWLPTLTWVRNST